MFFSYKLKYFVHNGVSADTGATAELEATNIQMIASNFSWDELNKSSANAILGCIDIFDKSDYLIYRVRYLV